MGEKNSEDYSRWSFLNSRDKSWVLTVILPTALLTLWCILSYGGYIRDLFLPTPSAVIQATVQLFTIERFLQDISVSILRVSLGFLASVITAVPIGVLIGSSAYVDRLLSPTVSFIRFIPPTAFIPLAVLWFGVGLLQNIVLVWVSVFFYLTILVADAAAGVPRSFSETALTLGASRGQLLRKVVLPAAAPGIWQAMRTMWGVGWTMLVVVELAGATSGVGAKIVRAQRFLQTPKIIGGILIIGAIGLMSDAAFRTLRRLLFPWAKDLRDDT